MNPTSSTLPIPLRRYLDNLELSLVLAMAVALPWDLFQRVPPFEVTVTKAAGAVLVLVVAARMLIERRRRAPRTGIEAPILLLLGVIGLASLASEDRAASFTQLTVYASYFLIYCAVAAVVSSAGRARLVSAAFVASSAGVGALALACRLGLATPTLVDTTRITGRWTTQDAWFDLTSRMAPASSDFNQGALPLLAAFCLALFLFVAGKKERAWPGLLAGLLALAGIIIALSRSSMLLALGLGAAFVLLEWRHGARRAAAGFAVSAAVAVAVLIALMGPTGVLQRITKLAGERDRSFESRIAAFEAGVALLPDYWITGTGPGASDAVIAKSAYGPRVAGITIHSVPFKLLLETGVAGLAALLWLYWRALRLHLRGLKNDCERLRTHSAAFLALGVTVFLITLVQPFMALALFPFLLGVAAGPLSARGPSAEPDAPGQIWRIVPAAFVAGVVIGNAADFYRTVERVRPFAETLVTAALAEQSGDWAAAQSAYAAAGDILKNDGQVPLHEMRYYGPAAEVLDVAYAYQRMGVRYRRLNPLAALCYGQGRLEAAQGYAPLAVVRLNAAAEFEPRFAQAHFTAAEILWDLGAYGKALDHYAKARSLETVRENAEFRQFVAPMDAFIAETKTSSDTGDRLRRAQFLRRRARWPEAVEEYAGVVEREPDCPEALFNLGVQSKLQRKEEQARDFFTRALSASPRHYETVRELAAPQPADSGL
ncbi:MAG: O-antigen ligase family protein [Candidatus Hydrogenedentes bacterium]|nr:O-antigen ligase family protein [Candidatus Hydrogenedentota bacterium]